MTKKADWARVFGSKERVEWVKQLNCVACGTTPCENAHVRNGGTGRKADARWIVPACARCHRLGSISMHNGIKTFQAHWKIDLTEKAAQTEERWQRVLKGEVDLGF